MHFLNNKWKLLLQSCRYKYSKIIVIHGENNDTNAIDIIALVFRRHFFYRQFTNIIESINTEKTLPIVKDIDNDALFTELVEDYTVKFIIIIYISVNSPCCITVNRV